MLSGGNVAELRYYAYGKPRYNVGGQKTDYRFTGQRWQNDLGMYWYNSRWYDQLTGRFLQPDTIVPQPGNPQSLNRYSYVLNNALRYTDPTGHIEEDEVDEAMKLIDQLKELYGILIMIDFGWRPLISRSPDEPGQVWDKGAWQLTDLDTVQQAVEDFAAKSGGVDAARSALGGVTIGRGSGSFQLYSTIELADSSFNQVGFRKDLGPRIAVVHELAHYWDWKTGGFWSKITNTAGEKASGMAAFVGQESGPTDYGRKNIQEAWAESVAMYVYPQYAQIIQSEGNPLEVNFEAGRPGLGSRHVGYVEAHFMALSGGWR